MKKSLMIILSGVSIFQLGFIDTLSVKPSEAPLSEKWINYSKVDLAKKIKTLADPLSRAAAYETAEMYEQCAVAARQVSTKSIISDRVHFLELRCANKALADEKVPAAFLVDVVNKFEKNQKYLKPYERAMVVNSHLEIVAAMTKKAQWKYIRPQIAKAFEYEQEMSKSERAELYANVGDEMIAERKWGEAFKYFSRAKELDSDVEVESRLKNVVSLLPQALRTEYENQKVKAEPPTQVGLVPSTEEQEFFDQAQSDISKNDPTSAVEAMVKLLKKFPASVKSKWSQDKIFELLLKEEDKSRGPQGNSVIKNKIVKMMLDLDVDRLSEWAKTLFDMQSYKDAALLYERAAELHEKSAKASKFLYMAARSYQLNLDFAQAKDFFRRLTKFYSMAPEFIDGSIQWALVNINEKEISEAITHLEMARSRKMTSQQDLITLFWLFHCYKQKGEAQLKNKIALDLVDRFPLTYYGILAYFEINQKLPVFEKSDWQSLKLSLSTEEWKVISRAKLLLRAGLLDDAADELSFLTQRKLNSDESLYFSQFFASALNYQKVFSLLSSTYDESTAVRDEKLTKTLFPREFWAYVNDDKKRATLDPYLLLAVMRQESAFKPKAVSRSGAIGLLQMIPPTAEEVKSELGSKIEIPKELFDPANNIKFCAYYLNKLIKKYNGDIPLALAAYNAGPTRISQFIKAQGGSVHDTWVDELPLAETSFYVKSILKNYIMYKVLYAGQTQLGTPPWLSTSSSP